jgi:hypothetical protein
MWSYASPLSGDNASRIGSRAFEEYCASASGAQPYQFQIEAKVLSVVSLDRHSVIEGGQVATHGALQDVCPDQNICERSTYITSGGNTLQNGERLD